MLLAIPRFAPQSRTSMVRRIGCPDTDEAKALDPTVRLKTASAESMMIFIGCLLSSVTNYQSVQMQKPRNVVAVEANVFLFW